MRLTLDRIKSPDIQKYLKESQGLEREYLGEVLTSRRNAWRITKVCGALTALSIAALVGLTPLKTSVPFILRVDNTTGYVDSLTHMKEVETSYGEAVDSYFLNQYILNRESYDDATIQTYYNTTALLSSPEVQKEYHSLFEGPQARDKVLGNHTKIFTQVRSIVADTKNQSAVVRFAVHYEDSNGTVYPLKSWIATIGYRYINAVISASDRRINPLGFQVTSYRIDPETIESAS